MAFISPAVDIFLFSFVIAVFINIFYKLLINQSEAKAARERIKALNAQMKDVKDNREKMDSLFKEIMSENNRLMRMSFKPMLISFAVILIALPWIGAAYGERHVDINGTAQFELDGKNYTVVKNENSVSINGNTCSLPCKLQVGETEAHIETQDSQAKISPIVAYLPFSAPLAGSDLGWLGWYFLTSVFFMIVSRRLMKIYV